MVLLVKGKEVRIADLQTYPLTVDRHNIYIEKLTAAAIPHDVYLKAGPGKVLLVGLQGVFFGRHLWVETTLVASGMITTYVFNMSNDQVILRFGQSVSHLLALPTEKQKVFP